ncbi:MAG: hypothetical protein KAI02_05645, partial [Gammaproteobacteria bacterium]|nr:hypothetical protein [Gammaproteobacteria bacterium]
LAQWVVDLFVPFSYHRYFQYNYDNMAFLPSEVTDVFNELTIFDCASQKINQMILYDQYKHSMTSFLSGLKVSFFCTSKPCQELF